MSGGRCSELSRTAGESLAATATFAERWLLVEVPGSWPRDVSVPGVLPEQVQQAVSAWLTSTPCSRLLFIRRPGKTSGGPVAFAVHAGESETEVRRIGLEALEDLASVDFTTDGDVRDLHLALVCGHGSRDACCSLRGTAVFGALAGRLGDEELWISSHHGGHRFAANVLVLPAGLHFGRVDPDEAPLVVARAFAGRIELGRYRGRTCYETAVQAAERAVRDALDLQGVADLRVEGVEGATVRFRSWDGTGCTAVVEEVAGPRVPASCGADPEVQRAFRARWLIGNCRRCGDG